LSHPPEEDDRSSESRDGASTDAALPQTDTSADVPSLPPDDESRFEYVHSASLPMLLSQYQAALVATSYQISRVLVLSSAGAKCSALLRAFPHPMGLAVRQGTMALACGNQVWELRDHKDLVARDGSHIPYDTYFIPRASHVTGDIDAHEIAWGGTGPADWEDLWIVNTRFSCLCSLARDWSFVPRWKPPFITTLAPEDRCHLNGLAMRDGKPAYLTCFAPVDTPQGWRENKAVSGCLLDVASGEPVTTGLSMPHSPRWYMGQLWVLESGSGSLQTVDTRTGARETVVRLPGYVRGLTFVGDHAFIGLSRARDWRRLDGLPLESMRDRLECAIYVVDVRTGAIAGFARVESGCAELFDVQVVRPSRRMNVVGFSKKTVDGIFVFPHGNANQENPR